MTIPKFRELLAQFQNQVEHTIHAAGEGVPVATTETGFIKRRDHLAEVESVRSACRLALEGLEQENARLRNELHWAKVGRNAASDDLAIYQATYRKLRARFANACRRIKELEARLPAKMPAEFREKSTAWIERLRVKAESGELE